jgi:hypothetical protein
MITVKYKEHKDPKAGVTKISTKCKVYPGIMVGSMTCRFDRDCSGKVDLENKTVECSHPTMN